MFQRVLAAAVVLLAAACSVQVPGTAAPAAPTGPAAAPPVNLDARSQPYAAELARVRTLDICALHDVRAFESITSSKAVSMRQRNRLTSCTVDTDTVQPVGGWEVDLDVGPRSTTGWASVTLGGTAVLKNPSIDSLCEYIVPIAPSIGLKAEVRYSQAANTGPEPTDEQRCVTGERYLSEVVLPKWKNPPKLADGLTTPRTPLLGKDPCAALAAGVDTIPEKKGRERTYSVIEPYGCEGSSGTAIAHYSVEFRMLSGLLDLNGPQVKIGDFTAYQGTAATVGSCTFKVAVAPQFLFSKREKTLYNGGVVFHVGTCAETGVVAKMLQNLLAQPDAPDGKPGAQLIGDLTGP